MRLALVIGVACLLIGFTFGWILSPGPFHYFYRTDQEVKLLAGDGEFAGLIPAGSILVSDEELTSTVDLGWWGYVGVYFDTAESALRLGVEPGAPMTSIHDLKLTAWVNYEALGESVVEEVAGEVPRDPSDGSGSDRKD